MELKNIIGIADMAYPDGLIKLAFENERVGDGLAEFIVRELKDTYDEKASSLEQLQEAARVMESARRELTTVAETLELSARAEEMK